MAWQCFIDERTGRRYKSRVAAERSKTVLKEHLLDLDEDELNTMATGLWRSEFDRHTIWRHAPCEAHRTTASTTETKRPVTNEKSNVDVVLVFFDDSLLWRGAYGVISEDDLDDRRQRDVDRARLQSICNELRREFENELLFVYSYSTESKLRVVDAFKRMSVNIIETPRLHSVNEFLSYVSDLRCIFSHRSFYSSST